MRNKYLNPRRADLHYFTREQTRSMSLYEPIGNPYGYGQYNDPVSAALSVSAMAGAYTTATAVGWTLASGMVFAGGAISLVGNVTGNESLMKIGAGVALVGGIGGAMNIEGFNNTFNGEVLGIPPGGEAGIKQASSSTAGNQAAGNLASGNQAVGGTGDLIPAPTDMNIAQVGDANTYNVAAGPGFTGGLGVDNVNALNTNLVTPAPQGIGDMYNNPFANARLGTEVTGLSGAAPQVSIGNIAASPPTGFIDYINKYPGVAMVGASTLAPAVGAIADYATGASDAQIAALKADTQYKQAMADLRREELLREQERIAALNDPNRYRGLINSQVARRNTGGTQS